MIRFFFLITIFFSNNILSESLYKFDSVDDEKRFYALIKEIKCPKCTSGSIASSNAPISEDIKLKIIELIKEGKSNEEIKIFLSQRFGSDVLYNPGLNKNTYFLWFSPILFLIVLLIGFFLRKKA
ncbi:MAG: cytochrome c-type biogenesis protein CcmH [SAR86 cluster bacterium]|jgi:cytochrome c-type biogenesis protein CcmH|uniref:Cytochrome c-type biogenesis protein n=1 Tax=SAR86 cluster bacterium TaxID=2030880 RepID=A0A937LIT9_9GAMM|nr:cytochrome c-type biogenesis protein CcmH [SAR86 cluster bacterium]